MTNTLTHQADWDRYWRGVELPAIVERGMSRADDVILSFLDGAVRPGARVLEIGGAPGQYLAYLARKHAVRAAVLDYSEIGCAKTKENFERLGLEVDVLQQDLFADHAVEPFDLVFSLGLIEHFADLDGVVERHLRLLAPGGTLVIGCPNFRGVSGWFLERLAPALMREHNLDTMNLARWDRFERALRLKRVFRGYVGGFEPRLFIRSEKTDVLSNALLLGARLIGRAVRGREIAQIDHPLLSQYALGVYQRA